MTTAAATFIVDNFSLCQESWKKAVRQNPHMTEISNSVVEILAKRSGITEEAHEKGNGK